MRDEQSASATVISLAKAILRLLRQHPQGLDKRSLATSLDTSPGSIQRAITWLREHHDAPVEFAASEHRWRLLNDDFCLPLSDPEPGDLEAVLMAQALLGPFADPATLERVRRLAEEMDASLRERGEKGRGTTRRSSLRVTVTTQNAVLPEVRTQLLAAVGQYALTLAYKSPWSPRASVTYYDVEPWQVRIHDGAYYLRAFSRNHQQARSFNVGHIHEIRRAEPSGLQAKIPIDDDGQRIWGTGDPALGIDHDRPDIATIVLTGPIARWVERLVWHPSQSDRWLTPNEVLERRVEYQSCREFARRLVAIGDGLVQVHPAELALEVERLARCVVSNLGTQPWTPS
jgi:predicted DNA-binding transcriptional regulator YafY